MEQNIGVHEPNKSNVLLTELVIVILFFALTAVTAMQMFVAAHHKSEQNVMIQRASIVAQNWAEKLTGELEPGKVLMDAGFKRDLLPTAFSRWEGGNLMTMEVGEEQTMVGTLVYTKIRVYDERQYKPRGLTFQDVKPLAALAVTTYLPDEEVTAS